MSQRQNSPQAVLTQGAGGRGEPPADDLGFIRHIWFSSASLLFIFKEMAAGVGSLRAGKGPQRPHVPPSPSADQGPVPPVRLRLSHGHMVTGLAGGSSGTALWLWPPGGSSSRFSTPPLGCCQGLSTFACVGPHRRAGLAWPLLTQRQASLFQNQKQGSFFLWPDALRCPGQAPLQGAGPCAHVVSGRNAIHPPPALRTGASARLLDRAALGAGVGGTQPVPRWPYIPWPTPPLGRQGLPKASSPHFLF